MNEQNNISTVVTARYRIDTEDLTGSVSKKDEDNILDRICSQEDLTVRFALTEKERRIVSSAFAAFTERKFSRILSRRDHTGLKKFLKELLLLPEIYGSDRLRKDLCDARIGMLDKNEDFDFSVDLLRVVADWKLIEKYYYYAW